MAEEYDVQAIMNALKAKEELDPDQHDGCYELMRETIEAYGKLDDFSILDYKDLNLVYLTTVGTWKQGVESKKKTVNDSHLMSEDKEYLSMLWDEIWDKAGRGEYSNYEMDAAGNRSIGLFGTGFFTFQKNTTDTHAQAFIKMCVDILTMTDDNAMYDRASEVLTSSFKGMKAASASMILHCLKPSTFPVLNSNMGNRNIFEVLGVDLVKKDNLETYIDNCRRIKAFRDKNFSYKNYRIFDMAAWKVKEYVMSDSGKPDEADWWPSHEEYDPGITADEYLKYFSTESIVKRAWVNALYELYLMPNHMASCKQLGDRYGYSPSHYISYFSSAGQNIQKVTGIGSPEDDKNAKCWPILFQGKNTKEGYCYKLREPVIDALSKMMSAGMFLEKENGNVAQFDHNLILYGPPGTGKTYNSVNYAVAICENKSVEEVMNESYPDVLQRYREYQANGRIVFTTFHQSYGYEEFIEGIRPVLASGEPEGNLNYEIRDGVFKQICKQAIGLSSPKEDNNGERADDDPTNRKYNVWLVSLDNSDRFHLKDRCFENDEIRFIITGEKSWIPESVNRMREFDLVLSYSGDNYIVDGVGVVSDSKGSIDRTEEDLQIVRKVNWMTTHERIDMKKILYGESIFQFFNVKEIKNARPKDVYELMEIDSNEEKKTSEIDTTEPFPPYVIIIDEINRGNVSKIFGELITLIEDTKRAGAKEAMEAILPYSGEVFSVPNNVYIIGTMNTADRSIALMDTALRRRFEFVEMMPKSEVLKSLGVGTIAVGDDELNVAKMLDVINERIEYLFDREHTIGHAFFTKLADGPSIETLADIFEKNVIPLLQEYFYEDYEKIQLVLGDNSKEDEFKFILDRPIKVKDIFNGNPDIDLPEKGYTVQHEAFLKLESYKQIGKDL